MSEELVNTNGIELLDATQEAVVDAAGNVETILKDTAEELHGGGEAFYLSAEFWVAMAFVLVVAGLFVPLKKALLAYLKKYADKEAGRIYEAENLKTEARELLASYEQKLEKMDEETAAVLSRAKKEVSLLKKNAAAELERQARQQEKNVQERINGELAQAESALTAVVTGRTMELLKKTLGEKLDDQTRSKLIDESIGRISLLK